MTEHLRPCPFCGGNDLTTERPASNPVGCDNCGLYVATPEDWNERALGPALDVVLEAVEAMRDDIFYYPARIPGMKVEGDGMPWAGIGREKLLEVLHALRNANSPTDTPSGSEEDK